VTGALTKLFSKSFAIGFLLPAAAFLLAVFGILYLYGLADPLLSMTKYKDETAIQATLIFFVIWLCAVALLALNRPIVRVLQGYGPFNPFRLKGNIATGAYRKLNDKIATSREAISGAKKQKRDVDSKHSRTYADSLWKMAHEFPDEEATVLPTRFGNTIRAFEVYSRVIYGIESVYGWSRLMGVVPADYREMMETEKAQMDFWVNLWFTSCLTVVLYVAMGIARAAWPQPWIPFAAIVLAFLTAHSARSVAQSWGAMVTGAFDLYRPDLCRKLGFRLPASIEEERTMWQCMSQVWVYRSAEAAERLNKYRLPEDQPHG